MTADPTDDDLREIVRQAYIGHPQNHAEATGQAVRGVMRTVLVVIMA